ncbi:ferrous iron transport protein A [Rickettsiales bacterium LUAb2]
MCIDRLNIGEKAVVIKINQPKDKAYLDELLSLGLSIGSVITCVRKSIFGNLLHIKLNNTLVVVRKKEACIVEVEKI